MMQNKIISLLTFLLLLTSCGSLGNGSLLGGGGGTNGSGSILGNILSSVLGSSKLSEQDLYGTWNYTGSDCVFESENILMKAGGTVAAAKVEEEVNEQLQKIGIKPGSCTFTFNEDKTFKAHLGGRTISGTYLLDTESKKLTLKTLLGLGTLTAQVAKSGNNRSLLFEGDKLLKLVTIVGSLSGNTAVKTLSDIAKKYDGMLIGLQLSK